MSFKAKDLQFDSSQPTFLRRLRGELAGDDSARHQQPIPRNKRLRNDEEDDAPTYVLEGSNQSLSKEEFEVLVSEKDSEKTASTAQDVQNEEKSVDTPSDPKDKIAEVGTVAKKRKAAKIISHESSEIQDGKEAGDYKGEHESRIIKRSKKKSKVVKLTFGDDEG